MAICSIRPDSYFGEEAVLAYADRAGMKMFRRFDDTKLADILELVAPLVDANASGGHQYVDLRSAAPTLTLSVDEYV
ncbi:hypothetical protein GAN17_15440 [Mycobacterium kubicae]|nr:hypothetical protein GAN17_15440 [Mycobacterium kubicae]